MSSPLAILDAYAASALPRPIPSHLRLVAEYLEARGIPPGLLRAALADLDRRGSAKGCIYVEASDEAPINELLGAPVDIECFDGCRKCADAARYRQGLLRPAGRMASPDDSDLDRVEEF